RRRRRYVRLHHRRRPRARPHDAQRLRLHLWPHRRPHLRNPKVNQTTTNPYPPMKKRILGRTGLSVTELGLGGLFVSRYGGAYEQGKAAIHRAMKHGVNYIDTAPGYGDSEEVLGRALEGVNTPLVFSNKL